MREMLASAGMPVDLERTGLLERTLRLQSELDRATSDLAAVKKASCCVYAGEIGGGGEGGPHLLIVVTWRNGGVLRNLGLDCLGLTVHRRGCNFDKVLQNNEKRIAWPMSGDACIAMFI